MQQTNQDRSHVLFSGILSHPKPKGITKIKKKYSIFIMKGANYNRDGKGVGIGI
jgi:hypothetical protein